MKSSSSKICCVPVCKALKLNTKKLVPFPKGKKQAKRWAEALGIDEDLTKNAYVCDLHFRQSDLVNSKVARQDDPKMNLLTKELDSNTNKLILVKTALPSRNLLNFTAAATKLKSCYIKLSPLPRLKKVVPPAKIQNKLLNFIVKKKLVKNNNNVHSKDVKKTVKSKSMQINNKLIDKLINTPENIKMYKNHVKGHKDGYLINIPTTIQTTSTKSTLKENSMQLESSNVSKTELKSILKNSSKETSNGKNVKKKVRIKTKLGQFMPKITSKKVVVRDLIKTNKEIIHYEVIEQINDCNVLILRI